MDQDLVLPLAIDRLNQIAVIVTDTEDCLTNQIITRARNPAYYNSILQTVCVDIEYRHSTARWNKGLRIWEIA